MNEIKELVGLLGGRSGRLSEWIAWLFTTGAVLKLFNARLQAWLTTLVAHTVQDPDDDRFMESLLGSRSYRFAAFLLDLAFRLKFPSLADYQVRVAARAGNPAKAPSSLLPLVLLGALAALALAPVGCGSTPNRVAYNTVATATGAVHAAVQGWWDYKAQFPGKITPGADAQVQGAYEKYQAAMKVVLDTYNSLGGWPAGTNAPAVLSSALANAAQEEADLVNLITTLKQ